MLVRIKSPRQAQEWSYSSHRDSIGKTLSFPGIRYNKKAHVNCGSAARMVGNVCANVDHIRRHGRWNDITINGAYLTNPPREMVRSMAGFPTCVRFFYLARAALNPPTSLCEKLFPAIDERHDRLAAKELNPGDPIQPIVAENAFVQIGYDDDDGNRDDDDANDDSTTASCRPKRLFLKFSNNLVVQVTNKSIPILCPYSSATISDAFTQLGRLCPSPFAGF
ncbi:hypothetical protein [Absidia glauca]|uniref:Ndc10 domain-containing protein n=1 Tax=Absidia glauca TaxID=4829 RepID=A0A168LPI6_ABSGL|nr:hypothetical protein [Absidia glauca]